MTSAFYEFLVRDARTLAILGEIRPQDVARASWTRHQVDAGSWSLVIPRASQTLLQQGQSLVTGMNLLEIRRDGEREYCGYIEHGALDPQGLLWTVGGRDLLAWLDWRVCGASTAEAASGVAETVIKAYVDDHLGPGAAAADRVATYLDGATFTVEGDSARGAAVEYSAQRRSLLAVTADLCRQGNLLQRMDLDDSDPPGGLVYSVDTPTDATVSSGGTPFAVGMDNVEGLGYRFDYRRLQNRLVVAGDGLGNTRTTRTVEDAASVAAIFPRDGVYAFPAGTTSDQLDAIGAAELQRQMDASVAADVVPLTTSANARYREDWDVGWDVTVAIPVAGVAAIDRRIVSAQVSLSDGEGERISFSLGTERPASVARRLETAINQLRTAAYG